MPAAYSTDIRGRVIASVESGSSRREAAEEFDVSPSSAIKWVATYRTTGSWVAKPRGGSTSPLEKHANFLLTAAAGPAPAMRWAIIGAGQDDPIRSRPNHQSAQDQ